MLHPALEPILSETYGVIIYQEQVMQIAQVLSGYSLGEADLLRRAMGKKKKEEMDAPEGALHVRSRRAWGRSRPRRLDLRAGRQVRRLRLQQEPRRRLRPDQLPDRLAEGEHAGGVLRRVDEPGPVQTPTAWPCSTRTRGDSGSRWRAPDINRSCADFTVEDGAVLYALGAVRNVGLARHGARRGGAPGRAARSRTFMISWSGSTRARSTSARLENLARAGAFDALHPSRAQILGHADTLMAYAQSMTAERASAQVTLFGEDVGAARPRLQAVEPWTSTRQLDEELAAVGFYLSGHPLEALSEVLRRKRTTLLAEAAALAEAGHEAFRMAGVVRRKSERPSRTGDKFALRHPVGPYRGVRGAVPAGDVAQVPRDLLEPGRSILVKVRVKGREGELRFFGDDAELLDVALADAATALRVYVSPERKAIDSLKRRLQAAGAARGGEVLVVAAMAGLGEVEMKLPGRFNLDVALRGALKTAPGVLYLEEA